MNPQMFAFYLFSSIPVFTQKSWSAVGDREDFIEKISMKSIEFLF